MASFFDIKARKQAAATNGTSSKHDKTTTETPKAQPWVEK
jgi:replication factor C subunit 2/4